MKNMTERYDVEVKILNIAKEIIQFMVQNNYKSYTLDHITIELNKKETYKIRNIIKSLHFLQDINLLDTIYNGTAKEYSINMKNVKRLKSNISHAIIITIMKTRQEKIKETEIYKQPLGTYPF